MSDLAKFDSYTFFIGQPWNHTWERQHELVTRFANELSERKLNIYSPLGLVNHNPISIDFLKKVIAHVKLHKIENLVKQNPVRENMNFITSLFIPYHNSTFISSINYHLLERKAKIGKNNFFFSTYMNPTVYEFFKRSTFRVYDMAERRTCNPYLNEYIKDLEKKAVKEADIVIADNHAIIDDYKTINRDIIYLPQGVNKDTFYKVDNNKREYIGYIGNLHYAIDYDFLFDLIEINKKEKFLFIGSIMEEKAKKLHEYKNVTLLPQMPKLELNNYLAKMKIGLIPYLVNSLTQGVYPTKLFEYLSAGVPVVSTPLPEVVQYENDSYMKIITEPEELSAFSFTMDGVELLVKNNTWDMRWKSYLNSIKECLK